MRKIEELEDRIKELEDFKYEIELKDKKIETRALLKELEKKYKVSLEFFIEKKYYLCNYYISYVKINGKIKIDIDISDAKNFKDAYDCIDYDEVENKIKAYLYDNRKQNKPKKVTKKIKKEEEK